jgi:hypothetical protein
VLECGRIAPDAFPAEETLGVPIREALDHR